MKQRSEGRLSYTINDRGVELREEREKGGGFDSN